MLVIHSPAVRCGGFRLRVSAASNGAATRYLRKHWIIPSQPEHEGIHLGRLDLSRLTRCCSFLSRTDAPVSWVSPDIMANNLANGEDLTFVVTPEELKHLRGIRRLCIDPGKGRHSLPRWESMFYFCQPAVRTQSSGMNYLQSAGAEKWSRWRTGVVWNGEKLDISVSPLSDGKIGNLFDGRDDTFIRSANINPLVIDMGFPQVTPLTGVKVRVGSEPITVTVTCQPRRSAEKAGFHPDPRVSPMAIRRSWSISGAL